MARIDRSEYPIIAKLVANGTTVADVAAHYGCSGANIYHLLARIRDGEAGAAAAKLLAKTAARPKKPMANGAAAKDNAGASTAPAAALVSEGASDAGPKVPETPPAHVARSPVPTMDVCKRRRRGTTRAAEGELELVPPCAPAFRAPTEKSDTQPAPMTATSSVPGIPEPVLAPSPAPRPIAVDSTAAPQPRHPETSSPLSAPPPEPACAHTSERPAPTFSLDSGRGGRNRNGRPSGASNQGVGLVMRTSDGDETVHPFRSIEELLSGVKPLLRIASRSPEPIWFSIQHVNLSDLSLE